MINKYVLIKLGVKENIVSSWLPFINDTLTQYEINTKYRISSYFSQILHESMYLTVWDENLKYSSEALIKLFPSKFVSLKAADHYARNEEAIANKIYANKYKNGSELSGDGWKYHGRGLIQITFKSNYINCGEELKIDLLNNPDLLLQNQYAALSSGWFWKFNNLNVLADKQDNILVSKRVNGGIIGLSERMNIYNKCLSIL